ncbi:twin-arginine translocation signal domain-containing protein [Lentisphaera profundi]|uniref:Twin-arginine translocation signal domain-containing protein n=1 Tax=Lentisphaera profundi TaxID=1658616 RepID=A0ABY7VXQ4_9BACT|nr:twin-arginine translocation signal domain-containing protein [Lentisphaera profundi]WDE98497.1 twin-arginine translocation signal domain-containing protein [Lentisphaera profundi]
MNNRRNFLKSALVASGTALLASCESNEEPPEDLYKDEDPFSYKSNSSFLTRPEKGFNYYKFNGQDYDGQERSESAMDKHRPVIKIAQNKKEFIISFGNPELKHPHKTAHYWTWVEITDRLNNVHTVAFPEPAKYDEFYGDEGTDFSAYIQIPEPITGWVRVRACCKPHGVFVNYANADA